MTTSRFASCLPVVLVGLGLTILPSPAAASLLSEQVLEVRDVNPDPDVFEAELSAVAQTVEIDGHRVKALIYKDENNTAGAYDGIPDGIPVPQIVVDVGDEVIVTFNNNLAVDCSAIACDSSIHWHGVEVDNDSDGTGVTQNAVQPGESYTYRFIAPRPGLFWFHPHMKPGAQVFAGMYGAFIVRDPREATLQSDGVIPGENSTHTIVLSDIEFDTPDPLPPDEAGNVGYIGLGITIPWVILRNSCAGEGPGTTAVCRIMHDGLWPLVNGQNPNPVDDTPILRARSGEGIRLRLINTAVHRYYRLSVVNNGNDNNLYRIGGEGGFLEHVRREGGVRGAWDTKFARGEIVVPASGRSDVVVVPTGNVGDVITITGLNYERGGPVNAQNAIPKPAGDLIYIEITSEASDPFTISDGDPILGPDRIENLKTLDIADLDALSDPPERPDGSGPERGTTADTIRMTILDTGIMAIDDVQGHFEHSGPDYTLVPYQGASRYARTGDTLELTVKNCSGSSQCNIGPHHPFHLHGFSFQPVKILDNETGLTLYEYDYDEFLDVIDVFTGQSVVFRVRLDDRPIITDNRQEAGAPAPDQFSPGGGAQGRWVYHCHLFLHASLGMISELVVLPSPVAICANATEGTDPGECSASDVDINDGSYHPGGGFITLTQDPDDPYPLGETLVTLTATDDDGQTGSCQATVSVNDHENPTITAPDAAVDECDSSAGSTSVALGSPVTADNCPGQSASNDAPAFFPLGDTTVEWTVADGSGNTAMADQKVTVQDTTDPTLDVPADIGPVECSGPAGETIDIGQASADDVCDDDVAITDDAPAQFTLGVTTVQWTATDDSDNSTMGTQTVTVADTMAPIISCNSAAKIAPSNVVTSFTATAVDICDANVVPEVTGFDCYSFNKNGRRIDRTDQCDIALRGEIIDIIDSGGVGDIIEWTLQAFDDSGNITSTTCTLNVVRKKDL